MTRIESRLTEALTDTARRNLPDATVLPPFEQPAGPVRPRGIRSWALPALAAAVVVAVTVGALALAHRGRPATHRVPAGTTSGSFVTLRAQSPLSAAELDRARLILIERAVALGGQGGLVQVVGSDEITMSLPGVAPADVTGLGAVDALEFRPLILNQTWHASSTPSGSSAGARRVVDPWKSLGFAPPKDAAGYQALSRAQQNAVQAAVRKWDCRDAPPDLPAAPIVACDQGRTAKYLLGPAIVTGDQIRSASAVSPGNGNFSWGVLVNFKAAGQRQWTDYTAQHNEQAHPADDANVVADVLDGDVLVAATIEETIDCGCDEVTANFTQVAATRLAGYLSAGVLPTPFDVISVRPN